MLLDFQSNPPCNGKTDYVLSWGKNSVSKKPDTVDCQYSEDKLTLDTSCPATRATGQPGVVIMAHVNSIRITDNPEHLRILRTAWKSKFHSLLESLKPGPGQGKTYTSKMYGCAEAIALLSAKNS